jgi:integrase/recombinase XerD
MNKILIKKYTKWLKQKNFSFETIKKYSRILTQYGKKEVNTNSITHFLKENLVKCEPATLRSKRNALASYAKFLKIYAKIEWENISRIIPRIQKRFFPTADYQDLEKLKNANTKTDKFTNERNKLILDFLFYTGLRVSELINIRHCDYQGK